MLKESHFLSSLNNICQRSPEAGHFKKTRFTANASNPEFLFFFQRGNMVAFTYLGSCMSNHRLILLNRINMKIFFSIYIFLKLINLTGRGWQITKSMFRMMANSWAIKVKPPTNWYLIIMAQWYDLSFRKKEWEACILSLMWTCW